MSKVSSPPLLGTRPPVVTAARVDNFVRTGAQAKSSKRRLQLYVTHDVSKSLAVYCARANLALSDAAEMALLDWLKQRGALETEGL